MSRVFKALAYVLGTFLGLLPCQSARAQTGSVFRALSQNGSSPIVLEYTTDVPSSSESSTSTRGQHAVELAQAPQSDISVPSFATELSASIMNEELRNKIDAQYVRDMKSFMYYYGYEATSLDARGRFHGIDQEREIEVRKQMARSVRNYMLSRGIPQFFLSRDDTKKIGETYQKVVESTHVNVALSKVDEEDISKPWTMATGFNPFKVSSYARVTNEVYTIEVRYNIGKLQGIEKSDLRNMDFHVMKRIDDQYSVGSRYNLFNKDYVPYVTYRHNEYLNTELNSSIPFARDSVINHVHTKISMSYLF